MVNVVQIRTEASDTGSVREPSPGFSKQRRLPISIQEFRTILGVEPFTFSHRGLRRWRTSLALRSALPFAVTAAVAIWCPGANVGVILMQSQKQAKGKDFAAKSSEKTVDAERGIQVNT